MGIKNFKKFLMAISFSLLFFNLNAIAAERSEEALSPMFYFSNPSTCAGESIFVDVMVENFTDMVGFQFTIDWNPNLLDFVQISTISPALQPTLVFGETMTGSGQLAASWYDSQNTGFDFTNGAKIFTLEFASIIDNSVSAMVSIDPNSITPAEYTVLNNGFITTVNGDTQEGMVSIAEALNNTSIVMSATGGTANGSIDLNVAGGIAPYTYLWSNGMTTEDISDLPAGDYSCIITAANGCVLETEMITVFPVDSPVFTVESAAVCVGEVVSIPVKVEDFELITSMAYSILWNNSVINFLAISDIHPSLSGLTSNDGTGFLTIGWNDSSNNGVTLDPGTTAFVLNFDAIGGGQQESMISFSNTPLQQQITFNDNGVITSVDGIFNDGTAMVSNIVLDNVWITDETNQMSNGGIDLFISGGMPPFQYSWNNGMTDEDLTNLDEGTFTCTITDDMGCTLMVGPYEVSNMSLPIFSAQNITTCENDTVVVDFVADNFVNLTSMQFTIDFDSTVLQFHSLENLNQEILSADYTNFEMFLNFSWYDPNVSGITLDDGSVLFSLVFVAVGDNLDSSPVELNGSSLAIEISSNNNGIFSIIGGEFNNATVTIEEPFIANFIVTENTSSSNNGSVDLTIGGGMGPFDFMWSNGATTEDIDGLAAGTFFCTITDSNGCSLTAGPYEVDNNVAVNEITSLTNFNAFPNPVNELLRITADFEAAEDVKVNIYNLLGQRVYTTQQTGQSILFDVDVSTFPSGSYILELQTPNGKLVEKLSVID